MIAPVSLCIALSIIKYNIGEFQKIGFNKADPYIYGKSEILWALLALFIQLLGLLNTLTQTRKSFHIASEISVSRFLHITYGVMRIMRYR